MGAREHYAIARALHSVDQPVQLFTDIWAHPRSPLRYLAQRLRDRYDEGLDNIEVGSANLSALLFETQLRIRNRHGSQAIIERNHWFQCQAVRWLKSNTKQLGKSHRKILFTYSYASLEILEWAKSEGWFTVLGQIDGGIEDAQLVAALEARRNCDTMRARIAPDLYWQNWEKECLLADHIVVNSQWSRALVQRALPLDNISVIPLAYAPSQDALEFVREYPPTYNRSRPLRVLFLGHVTIRKGILELLEAARILDTQPVEFIVVGPRLSRLPESAAKLNSVKFIGPVPRGETHYWFKNADVFIFPTHSDGFGLTQLEAQSWKLPVIASRSCGDVVVDGVNGRLLRDISGETIANVIDQILSEPSKLRTWSNNSGLNAEKFELQAIGNALCEAVR